MSIAIIKRLVLKAQIELAALVPNPDAPDFGPVTRNNNTADAECIACAFNILRDDLPSVIEDMEVPASEVARLREGIEARRQARGFLVPEDATDALALADALQAELDAACGALRLVLPLAKGYAAAHPAGSNAEYVTQAERVLAGEG